MLLQKYIYKVLYSGKAAERNKLREAVHDDKVQKTVSLITNRFFLTCQIIALI